MKKRKEPRRDAKEEFGDLFKAYRVALNLSQVELGTLLETGSTYISRLERGEIAIGLDNLDKYAGFFGVRYYHFVNPEYPIPTFDALPAASRRAIGNLRKQLVEEKSKETATKNANREAGVPGRAKQLHQLLAEGFFKRSKTAKQTFAKLNPTVAAAAYGDYTIEIGKITNTLSSGRFLKLLDKLEPAPGSTAVRFVVKDPAVIRYFDGPTGTKDMAADEG